MKNRPADRALNSRVRAIAVREPGEYFNIKCIGKLPGPTNEFERSLVFETGEFERPKFDCISIVISMLLVVVSLILDSILICSMYLNFRNLAISQIEEFPPLL